MDALDQEWNDQSIQANVGHLVNQSGSKHNRDANKKGKTVHAGAPLALQCNDAAIETVSSNALNVGNGSNHER